MFLILRIYKLTIVVVRKPAILDIFCVAEGQFLFKNQLQPRIPMQEKRILAPKDDDFEEARR